MRTSSDHSVAALPSPPTDRELAILRRVLQAETVPGVEQLLAQLRMLQVAPVSDATRRIYVVHGDAPRSKFAREGRSTLPTRLPVRTPAGRVTGEIVVWVQHGHLCALQYVAQGPGDPMVLPPPEWIEVPAAVVSIAISARGARQAVLGAQALATDPDDPVDPTGAVAAVKPPGRRRAAVIAGAIVAVLCVAALAVAAFLTASAGGADVGGSRAAGAAAGAALGAEHGEVAGRFAGDVEGRVAGRNLAYPPAFVRARDREQAELRDADNATCAGDRDADGLLVCP